MTALSAQLAKLKDNPTQTATPRPSDATDPQGAKSSTLGAPVGIVPQVDQKYRELALAYAGVSGFRDKVRSEAGRFRRTPEFAAVLSEPEARELFQTGRRLEMEGKACCAYQLYEEAKQLLPAPSAKFAAERFAMMSQDAQLVAEAKACADLQWCQSAYLKAEDAFYQQSVIGDQSLQDHPSASSPRQQGL